MNIELMLMSLVQFSKWEILINLTLVIMKKKRNFGT